MMEVRTTRALIEEQAGQAAASQILGIGGRVLMAGDESDAGLDTLANTIRRRLRNDYDVACCIDGVEGFGKSTMAYWLCKKVDPDFDPTTRIAYSIDHFLELIYKTPRYGAVMIDGGMEVLYKRKAMDPFVVRATQIIAMARQRNLFYVITLPQFHNLDVNLREWRIRLWIHLYRRGRRGTVRPPSLRPSPGLRACRGAGEGGLTLR
jgi:hypothetical protein